MGTELQITNIVNEITRVDSLEEAFSCFLVQNTPEKRAEEILRTLMTTFTVPIAEQESGVKQFLLLASSITNHNRNRLLFNLLESLVLNNTLPARLVCQCILTSEKLVYTNEMFWVECFSLIQKIISKVDYKGVREIMKGCWEKATTLPAHLNSSVIHQMKVLENVVNYIFDRNACLLPAYFIQNELHKAYPDGKNWPHWKLAKLLSSFVESFRPTAQMVSIIGHDSMLPIVELSGYSDYLPSPWKLDSGNLTLTLKGNLPYEKNLREPQIHLLRYVLEQPYSRDMVCSMLSLQKQHKQRCTALEEQFVELIMLAMERTEAEMSSPTPSSEDCPGYQWLWHHISSQLICFILSQYTSFNSMVLALHDKLTVRDLRKGRDHLMWVLLQYISGSIQKNSLNCFLSVFKLYDLLYPEKDPLPVPDYSKPLCTHQLAVTCIWIHLMKRTQVEHINLQRTIPHTLKLQYEFLQQICTLNNVSLCLGSDYRVALVCNAYSTNQEFFTRTVAAIVDTIFGNQKGPQQALVPGLSSGGLASGPTTPLTMSMLDSLTVHCKMSLIHNIVSHVIKLAQSKSNMALSPALVETYSRLLVYTEMETLGIKNFISTLLPSVFKYHAWGILYTLLEMFSYRMHHIQPHYRVQLLSHLHSLAAVPQTNQTQLHLCVESTALRLITGLGSNEVQPQISRFLNESKTLVSAESEELNRTLVFTLARSMHVTGTGSDVSWCKELLNTIMQNTPLSWAPHTLQCFPPALHDFFQEHNVPKENKQQLKKAVEEEYRNWASMNNENDIIAHFSVPGTPPLFLCLLWKMILETDRISPIAYKILERIGARGLSAHLRKFCDYVVFEVAVSDESLLVNKCVDAINLMVWQYNIVTVDRLVLCLALRTHEGNEAQVCFFIIQLILFKDPEFRNRVNEFVKENSPQHWKQSNWHEKHLAFHRKYPEKFGAEQMLDQLPVYFGNICLRFLPVFDIVIHRYLEIPPVAKSLETLLGHLGTLYKFHDCPVTYLYNTFHYYEKQLRERTLLKRKMVLEILGKNEKDESEKGWCLSEAYSAYMQQQAEKWVPELDYYIGLIRRLVETMSGPDQFPHSDWRFNEFPNPAAHTLYGTCIELMALPVQPSIVANNLLDVITKGYTEIPDGTLHQWINSLGLVMSALPDSYWSVLHDRLFEVITCPELTKWPYRNSPFQMFNFSTTRNALLENKFSYTLATAHAIWHHAGVGHLNTIPKFVKEKLSPTVKTEEQMLFLCHLVGPFLLRFATDCQKRLHDLVNVLYTVLDQVDKAVEELRYMDPICDLLYHIKYMYIGDTMKTELETVIRRLRPDFQRRLRFIVHLNPEEIPTKESNAPVR